MAEASQGKGYRGYAGWIWISFDGKWPKVAGRTCPILISRAMNLNILLIS